MHVLSIPSIPGEKRQIVRRWLNKVPSVHSDCNSAGLKCQLLHRGDIREGVICSTNVEKILEKYTLMLVTNLNYKARLEDKHN